MIALENSICSIIQKTEHFFPDSRKKSEKGRHAHPGAESLNETCIEYLRILQRGQILMETDEGKNYLFRWNIIPENSPSDNDSIGDSLDCEAP
jgi:hypothetical protein